MEPVSAATAYEDQLDTDPEWAMAEGSRHFDQRSAVHAALRKVTERLNRLGVSYAVVGGMALFRHGFRRFTEDIDILVTRDGLKTIHRELEGLGWRPPFTGSKNLRDTEHGVRVEFIVAGDYPGDGKPKPVAFPDPATVAEEHDGIHWLELTALVELKLASGMTGAARLRDLADVQELIRLLALPAEFGEQLNPFVRDRYAELWGAVNESTRFARVLRGTFPHGGTMTFDEIVAALPDEAASLREMEADGVRVDGDRSTGRAVRLVTTDPGVARKHDMHDESELLDDDEEEDQAKDD